LVEVCNSLIHLFWRIPLSASTFQSRDQRPLTCALDRTPLLLLSPRRTNYRCIHHIPYTDEMQSSISPRHSFDDTGRDSPQPRCVSPGGDSPRRKSIQFNIGGVEAQSPVRRSSSVKVQKRSQIEVPEKDQKSGSVSRGLSPPPPRYVPSFGCTCAAVATLLTS
jgi:hypothetical protein